MKGANEFGAFVLDSSITISWFVPDEADARTKSILDDVAERGAWVPMIWPIEVGNGLSLAIRRRRISLDSRNRALDRLGVLPIRVDRSTLVQTWRNTLKLADQFRLTLYDACYLELARRRRLPLASLDNELRAAGSALGVPLLGV